MTETKKGAPKREETKIYSVALLLPEVLRIRMHESSKGPGSIDIGAHETEIVRRALKTKQVINNMRNQLQQEGKENTIKVEDQQLTDEKLKAQMYDLQKGHKSRFNLKLPFEEWEKVQEATRTSGTRSITRFVSESIVLHLAISETAAEQGQKYHARLSIGGKEIVLI